MITSVLYKLLLNVSHYTVILITFVTKIFTFCK